MKSLKTKASRFFKDSPTQDEKVANADSRDDLEFDAGIRERGVKKKPSRFFLRKNDKPLPVPPSNASWSTLATHVAVECGDHGSQYQSDTSREGSLPTADQPSPFPTAPRELANSPDSMSAVGSACSSSRFEVDAPKLKPRSSFATLRSKGSRFFRNNDTGTPSPPPPPVPQIPVEPIPPQPHRTSLAPLHAARNPRSSLGKAHGGSLSISRPVLLPHSFRPPIPEFPATVPFTKRTGPPPQRPPRPESLDQDILAFMRESGTRMVLSGSNRISDSTASSSTPRSHSSSIEARLGLPSGYDTPTTSSLDSPLAARFPLDALQPLQVRDSSGNLRVSRFSEFIKALHGGYAGDGVDDEDRELGPIEQWDPTKEGDWTLVKRVSASAAGRQGMLFRDKWGGFHFVADI